MATPLEFVIATLAEKKLLDAKGPFGDYLFKKSGQIYIAVFYLYMLHSTKAIQCQIMATKRRDLDTGGNLSTRRSWCTTDANRKYFCSMTATAHFETFLGCSHGLQNASSQVETRVSET